MQDVVIQALLEESSNSTIKNLLSYEELSEEANRTFYTKTGNQVEIRFSKPFNNGYCGKVHLIEGLDEKIVFKKYLSRANGNLRIKADVFEFLKELNHPNMLNLIDYYYNFSVSKEYLNEALISAYTYHYVEETQINPLYEDKYYLLENLRGIEGLIRMASNENILVSDLKRDNTILNDEAIVISDPDCWNFMKTFRTDLIRIWNKRELLQYMRDLLEYYSRFGFLIRNENDLFSQELEEVDNITDVIAKRLWFKKKPISYFK